MAIFESLLLASLASSPLVRVPGTVDGFNNLRDGDDQIDGALVMPSMRPQEVLQFQLEAFLAPKEDLVVGPKSTKVPGNLFFPTQSEKWGILPIQISKPEFGFYTTSGRTEELVTLSFRAPFSRIVDLAINKLPFTEAIPLLSLRQYSFAGDRDWSGERALRTPLTGIFNKTASFNWNRSAAPTNGLDLAIHFQKTPANRWMPTDIAGRPGATGRLSTAASPMLPDTKALFLRILNGADKKPVAGAGYFFAGETNSNYSVNGVPAFISNAKINGTQVTWDAIPGAGWMAVVREKLGNISPSGVVVPDLRVQRLEAWTNASQGAFTISTPIENGETLILIYVGTSREVPAPAINDAEPLLFTYASEMRFQRL